MSAVTPAPEEGSKPAIVSTTVGVSGMLGNVPQTLPAASVDRRAGTFFGNVRASTKGTKSHKLLNSKQICTSSPESTEFKGLVRFSSTQKLALVTIE
jgi:hypothetical protein